MKFTGIWPEERKWNRPSSYVVLIPCFMMLCFGCGPQTVNLPFIAHDLNLVVENLSMANMTTNLNVIFFTVNGVTDKLKAPNIYHYTKTHSIQHFLCLQALKLLLKCIAEDWATVETKIERETMVNVASI
ncbi:unnamed protein product, partial [Heterotrigona itama]